MNNSFKPQSEPQSKTNISMYVVYPTATQFFHLLRRQVSVITANLSLLVKILLQIPVRMIYQVKNFQLF